MSFLLDALRKSEKHRRLGAVPNIHSATELESRAPRNPGLKPVLLLALGTFLVLAWFGWRRYAPPEETVVAQPSPQIEPGISAGRNGSGDASRDLPEIPRQPGTVITQKPGRTAVERYSGPTNSGSADRRQPAAANRDSPAAGDAPVLRGSNVPTSTAATVPGEAEAVDGSSWTVSGNVPDPAENDKQAFQPGLISYWQLPESVRQELPAFRISVIVFAQRPQDRFILLNGVRLIEGDEPQPDLVLEEIRREGAVFSYRLYQFLVTQ